MMANKLKEHQEKREARDMEAEEARSAAEQDLETHQENVQDEAAEMAAFDAKQAEGATRQNEHREKMQQEAMSDELNAAACGEASTTEQEQQEEKDRDKRNLDDQGRYSEVLKARRRVRKA